MNQIELLCKDCKYSFVSLGNLFFTFGFPTSDMHRCRKAFKPNRVVFDPVYGNQNVKGTYRSCNSNRANYGDCKPIAIMWAPKHKKDLFKMLTKETHHD